MASPNQRGSDYIEAWSHQPIFRPHAFPEQTIDLGEIRLNYATAGSPSSPPLVLIPGQTNSWWAYEAAMHLLALSYHVFAVDLRGQGRSTWTPGRYTLDIWGNDMVRFLARVVQAGNNSGRPAVVCGSSSGGLVAAWLAAFALPGQVKAVVLEDAPLFSSEVSPPVGHGMRQTVPGMLFAIWARYLGPQWRVNDKEGMRAAVEREVPGWARRAFEKSFGGDGCVDNAEYDPEWAEAFCTGRAMAGCDQENMLRHVKVPVLFTHHFREVDAESGGLLGAVSDLQVRQARQLIEEGAGCQSVYLSFPDTMHSMHRHDPVQYVKTVTSWMAGLGFGEALTPSPDQILEKDRAGSYD